MLILSLFLLPFLNIIIEKMVSAELHEDVEKKSTG